MRVVEELARDGEKEVSDPPRIYGVVVGRVIDILDPLPLGRVRVEIPDIDGLDLSAWARVATPGASMASGIYWIPNPGDEVLVAFEQGDVKAPYIIGSLWSAIMPPPMPTPLPQIRMIRTPLGNQIVFTEVPPTLTIQNGATVPISPPSPVGPHQTITLNGVTTFF